MTSDPHQLRILLYPDPALRARTMPVDPPDPEINVVVERMIELMFEANGAGLAAPQVGLPWKLFVTLDPQREGEAMAWLNPRLEILDETHVSDEEGCLSLPGITVEVNRPALVRITGQAVDGSPIESTDEWLSRVVQHENDHLDGVLIIDRMTTMERIRNRKAIKQLKSSARNSPGD
ncbi:MAG: peptide deformylase [Phycisphaerae bacterium]|nr:peptide deformylase [Phycisphaerae bacterium]